MAGNASEVRTKVTVTNDKQVRAQLKTTTDAFANLGKGAKGIIPMLSSLGPVAGAVAAGLGVLTAELKVLELAVKAVGHLAQRGGEISAIADRFERIGSPETLRRLQDLSGLQIQQRDIMASYSQVMEVGLISAEEYEQWIARVTRMAQDRGGDPTEWLQRFTQVLSGGGMEQLREMGVNVHEIMAQVRAMGLSMESGAGRAAAMDLALAQMNENLGEVDNSSSNLADTFQGLRVVSDDFLDNMGRMLSTNPQLVAAFDQLNDLLRDLAGNAGGLGEIIGNELRVAAHSALMFVTFVSRIFRQYYSALADVANLFGADSLSDSFSRSESAIGELIGRLSEMQRTLRDPSLKRPEGPGDTRSTRPPRRTGRQTDAEAIAEMEEEILERMQEREAAEEARAQRAQDRIDSIKAAQDEADDAIRAHQEELEEAKTEAIRERHQFEREQAEETARLLQEKEEELQRAIERRTELTRQGFATAEQTVSAFGQAMSLVGDHMQRNLDTQIATFQSMGKSKEEIADLTKKQAESVDTWRKVEGVALGIKYGIQAGAEVAESVASFAKQDYLGGVQHIVAAGLFTAQSIAAFTQLAQTGGGAAASGGGSSRKGGFTASRPERAETKATTAQKESTIHYYSLGRTSGELGRVLREADWSRERDGEIARVPQGVTHG